MGSNGSVIPFFNKKKDTGVLQLLIQITTRFNITLSEGVDIILHALENAWGGEFICT